MISTMAQHGISWHSMVYRGIAWYEKLISFYMVLRGILWCNFLNHFFIPHYVLIKKHKSIVFMILGVVYMLVVYEIKKRRKDRYFQFEIMRRWILKLDQCSPHWYPTA